jgi:hypothetical protein
MSGFDPVTITWRGVDYTIPPNRQLGLIRQIEIALAGDTGLQAISVLFRREGPPHSLLAMAFAAALRYAGCQVTDDEIYLHIHSDIANKSRDEAAATMQTMLMALLSIISPPAARSLAGQSAGDGDEKKP